MVQIKGTSQLCISLRIVAHAQITHIHMHKPSKYISHVVLTHSLAIYSHVNKKQSWRSSERRQIFIQSMVKPFNLEPVKGITQHLRMSISIFFQVDMILEKSNGARDNQRGFILDSVTCVFYLFLNYILRMTNIFLVTTVFPLIVKKKHKGKKHSVNILF